MKTKFIILFVMNLILLIAFSSYAFGASIAGNSSMSPGSSQILSVENPYPGTTYTWEITHGDGSLSSGSGASVTYNSSSSNENCINNPTILLKADGMVEDSFHIAVNAFAAGSTAYSSCNEYPVTGEGGEIPCYYGNKPTIIICAMIFDCIGEPLYAGGNNDACCVSIHGEDAPIMWNADPEGCASGAYGITSSGIQDFRTETMKTNGCCPFSLLLDNIPSIDSSWDSQRNITFDVPGFTPDGSYRPTTTIPFSCDWDSYENMSSVKIQYKVLGTGEWLDMNVIQDGSNYTSEINTSSLDLLDGYRGAIDVRCIGENNESYWNIGELEQIVDIPGMYYDDFDSDISTNLTAESDITNVTNLTLGTEDAIIQFPEDYGVNAYLENYNEHIIFGDCFVSVNSSALNITFNATAYLILNNSDGHCGVNRIYKSESFHDNVHAIRAVNSICADCDDIRTTNEFITEFRVSGFSSYAIGANTRLDIYDEYEGSSVVVDTNITFYANYTNKTSSTHIGGADCLIEFDDNLGTSYAMTDNGNNYNYTKIGGFNTSGVHSFYVNCSNATGGWNELNASDDVEVSSGAAIPEFSTVTLGLGLIAVLAGLVVIRRKRQ